MTEGIKLNLAKKEMLEDSWKRSEEEKPTGQCTCLSPSFIFI